MSEQILATKLHIPSVRPGLVPRPSLIERLNQGLHRKLTLISAPAGFGKTTLLGEWIPHSPRCVTWLSLDEGDKESMQFWTYFIHSLQRLRPDLGSNALMLLQSQAQTTSPITSILTSLINDIAGFPDSFAMVLDDYHVIDAKPVDEALAYLLKHLPPQMHLILATREDPNLPLSRLRARDQLNELRAADLRFSSAKASEFLNRVMGLGLSEEEVNSLDTRTEGWIAGLQLAALSMKGREDVHGFIKTFAGDNRYIVDYLVEEVLQRQPGPLRNFLLQTSILERLNGALCDAVTGQGGSNLLLDNLERGNLFVVPLDDKRMWFRYHHLFSDVLKAHLMEEQAEQIPGLHQRASRWYEENDFLTEAVQHALAAGDLERAANLIELTWPEMDKNRQYTRWLGWVKRLPNKTVRVRPVLCAGYAWALLDRGRLEAAKNRLGDAEKWLDISIDNQKQSGMLLSEMVVADQQAFHSLPATIASGRAYYALAVGDVPATLKYARRALDLLPEKDYHHRATPDALLALATWTDGDLESADRALEEAMDSYQMEGNILFAITGAFILADIRTTLGRLHQALDTYEEYLQLATEQAEPVIWGTADLHTGISEVRREQNDLHTTAEHLLRSRELGEKAALPRWHFRWCLAKARLKESLGDLLGALDLLDEAERRYVRGPVPDVRPISAIRARVWIRQGRLSEALGWAEDRGLSADDEITYLGEFEHIVLARSLIAQFKNDRLEATIQTGLGLLERLLETAQVGKRMGSIIEMLVLQALAYQAKEDTPHALRSLERALNLAEPEGYVRIFIDEGLPMARLLSAAAAQDILPDYTRKLLAALGEDRRSHLKEASIPALQPLTEPLSQRELEVLRLVAQGLSNQEIGERLFLAVATVKGYNRTIFNKLQVHRRTEAVARASELGLL